MVGASFPAIFSFFDDARCQYCKTGVVNIGYRDLSGSIVNVPYATFWVLQHSA